MKKDRGLEESGYYLTITVREPGCQDETASAGHAGEGPVMRGLFQFFQI
jgi:hypothetical protein